MSKYDLGIQDLANEAGQLIDAVKLLHRNENVATQAMDNATRTATLTSVQNAIERLEEIKTVIDPEYTLSLRFIDCCSVDHLTDHLNGIEEELVSIDAHSEMLVLDIETMLSEELACNEKFGYISEAKLSELVSSVSSATRFSLVRTVAITEDGELPDDTRLWFALTW